MQSVPAGVVLELAAAGLRYRADSIPTTEASGDGTEAGMIGLPSQCASICTAPPSTCARALTA